MTHHSSSKQRFEVDWHFEWKERKASAPTPIVGGWLRMCAKLVRPVSPPSTCPPPQMHCEAVGIPQK